MSEQNDEPRKVWRCQYGGVHTRGVHHLGDEELVPRSLLAQAWDEGWQANDDRVRSFENPYREADDAAE